MNSATVIQINKGFCKISLANNEVISARLKSSLYGKGEKVICGDKVIFERIQDSKEIDATIIEVKKRGASLNRPPISNLDEVYFVISLVKPFFNYFFLSKALMYLQMNKIKIKIILTKTDIVDIQKAKDIKENIKKEKYDVYFSNELEKQFDDSLKQKKIIAFIGRSGVGKTTLINNLFGTNLKTQAISEKLNRGKHTTTTSKGIVCGERIIFDTPGFETLYFKNLTRREVASYFFNEDFISELECSYSTCDHLNKSSCNLYKFLIEGKISKERFDNYEKILNLSNTTRW